MYIYIYIERERVIKTINYMYVCRLGNAQAGLLQDSSKVGAVETGCSDLYDVMY